MKDRSRISKKQIPGPKPTALNRQSTTAEPLPEAIQRMKDNAYPLLKTGDMLQIQQGLGNKALGSLVKSRGFGLQRHAMPEGRQGLGEEDDEVQAARASSILQRHAMSSGREGVGEDEDEIQTALVQRSPGFGQYHTPPPARMLWGDGRRRTVQRKDGEKKAEGKIGEKVNPDGGMSPVEGKVDSKKAPETKIDPKIAEEEAAKKQAEDEYKKFTAGGPYRINPYVPDQVDNFGKFESIYDPANRTLTADMRVKFEFPDLPEPKGDTLVEKIQAPLVKLAHQMYQDNFIKQVHAGWSGRFTFKNVREPQSVWGKLNPITVKVNVHPVESNQHYLIKGYFNKTGTANVSSNTPGANNPSPSTLTMFKGDLDPMQQDFTNNPNTGKEEIQRLQRNLPKIHFANGSMEIAPKYMPDLQYVADYLRQMNRPKFIINVVGHANKTGSEKSNLKYSAARAQIVMDKLKALGVANHTLGSAGLGSAGATEDGSWRKVDFAIKVDKSFSNVQDVTVHEFGHMLGLDDEYVRGASDTRSHTTQKELMAKMLGDKAYGAGKEGKLGEEVTSVLPLNSASVMESGNEVRPYHYVTLWQALYDTAAKAPAQPAEPLSWKDWKVSGY